MRIGNYELCYRRKQRNALAKKNDLMCKVLGMLFLSFQKPGLTLSTQCCYFSIVGNALSLSQNPKKC